MSDSTMRVLYVEDNPADADLAARELARRAPGIVLDVAQTLRDGRQRLDSGAAYDLVLTDVNLPDGNGLEFLAEIRQRDLPLAVVVLTGADAADIGVAALKAGADDYLVKRGGYTERLGSTLEAALARYRSERDRRTALRVLYATDSHAHGEMTLRHFETHARHIQLELVASLREMFARLPASPDAECPYDVLLLEVQAVRVETLDALRVLRGERGLDVPVVVVSGENDGEVAVHALRFGASDYVAARPGYLFALPAMLQSAYDRALMAREQAKLRASEQRLRAIIDGMHAFVSLYDTDGVAVEVSQYQLEWWGLQRDDVIGHRPWEEARWTANPAAAEELRRSFAAAVQGVTVRSDRTVEIAGRSITMDSALQPVFDEQGRVTGILGFGIDITERTRMANELRQSEDRYRDLVENSLDLICTHDLEGNLISVNSASARLTGYPIEELLRMNLRDLLVPQGRPLFGAYLNEVASKGSASGVMVVQTATGEIRQWEYHNTLRAEPGSQPVIRGMARDVTDQRQAERKLRDSEAQFRAVFASSPIPLVVVAADGSLVEVNQAFSSASGFSRDEAVGATLVDLGMWRDDEQRARFQQLVQQGGAADVEASMRMKDGSVRTLLLSGSVVPIAGVPHVLTSAVDITVRKEAEVAVRESEAQFRAVFDLSPNPLVLSTFPDGAIVATNIPLDQTDGASVVGTGISEIGWWTDSGVRDRYVDLLTAESHVDAFEAAIRRRDGTMMTALLSGSIVTVGGRPHSLTSVVDITDRKQAEDALRESQQRYERVVEHISDALIIDDLEGRVVFANRRFFEVFGIPPTDDRIIAMEDYVAPEWKARLEERHGRRMAGEDVPAHFEYEGIRGDGRRIWLEVDVARISDDGQAIGTQSTIRDITDRKLTERTMALLSTGVAHLRGEAFFGEVATQIAQLLGVDVGFVGRLMPTPEPRIRTLGMAIDGTLVEPFEYDIAGTPCERVVGSDACVIPGRLQELFPANQILGAVGIEAFAAVRLFDMRGRPIGHIGVMSREPFARTEPVETLLRLFAVPAAAEIERQRTEAQFENLFHHAPDGIVMVDAEGSIVEANPQAEALFGYTRAELLGLSVVELVPEASRGEHTRSQEGFLAAPTSRQMGSDRPGLSARRKDGTVFPTEISLSPIQGEDGVVVVATIRDMSERAQAEEDRRALEGQLWQAQKMEAIGTLAGGIAHDFNNILAAIIGNTELAAMDIEPNHPAAETLDEIRQASTRAKDLVRQILAFSRHQEQPRNAISLGPVVDEVAKLMRAALPASVEIRTHIAPGTPTVLADPSQIHQVLMNLCTNGWHAMEGMLGTIDVRLEGTLLDAPVARRIGGLEAGYYAHLSVADSGKGMDAATAERVFEPFFTTKEVGSGTGLGLAVVHGIIRSHGGEITVQSRPGEGATFDAYLPASVDAETPATVEDPSLPRGQGQHVLYVDDERALVTLATRLLERLGYRVTSFGHPDEALVALRANPRAYDVLLTDLNMPAVSGLELIREARVISPHLPAILLSGYTDAEIRSTAASAGVHAVLTKPTSSAELAAALRAAVTDPRSSARS